MWLVGAGNGCRVGAETVWGQRPNLASPRQTQTGDKRGKAGNRARTGRDNNREETAQGTWKVRICAVGRGGIQRRRGRAEGGGEA